MARTQSTAYSYLSAYIIENSLRMNCKRNDNDARNAPGEGGTVSAGPVARLANPGLLPLVPLRLLLVVGLSIPEATVPAGLLASRVTALICCSMRFICLIISLANVLRESSEA